MSFIFGMLLVGVLAQDGAAPKDYLESRVSWLESDMRSAKSDIRNLDWNLRNLQNKVSDMGTLSLKARVNLECIDKLDAADAEANDAAKIVKFIEACTPELNEKVCKVAGSSVDNDCYGKAEAIKVAAFTVAEVEQVQKACAQRTALCQ